MRRDELLAELAGIVAALPETRVLAQNIAPTHRLREDLGLDSIGMIDLIVAIEERFEIVLDPIVADFETAFETVGSLAEMVGAGISEDQG